MMPRYIGLPCNRVPGVPSGMCSDDRRTFELVMCRSGMNTFSIRTPFEPLPRMPRLLSPPQSSRMVKLSRGTAKLKPAGRPSASGRIAAPTKWVASGTPDANVQTPEAR